MGSHSRTSVHAPVEKLDAEQAEELARLAKNVEQNGNKLDRMQVSVDSVVANADHVARTVKQVRGVAARMARTLL